MDTKTLFWKTLNTRYVYENNFLKIRQDDCLNYQGETLNPYYICEMTDWVVAIARTVDGKFILEKSYRHAIQEVHYEIPAGCIDLSDADSLEAIKRELLEETGYVFNNYLYLGTTRCNPAIFNNFTHIYFADGGVFKQEPNLEPGESFFTEFVSLDALIELYKNNKIVQSLHITALTQFFLHQGILKF
ncbi:MAG: NUDIX hydrolase [Alphaproteobacteria bacterium]|nr:NUDIX hydrolase [Alphaproteobacteria bacterium]